MEMESEKKKKSRKRERTEAELEPRTGEVKEEEETTVSPEAEPPAHRGLVRSSEKEEDNSKSPSSLKQRLITTIAKTTTTTTSITVNTPPEDPNSHIDLYLCIKTDLHAFSWIKIDPNNSSSSRGNLKKNQQQPILVTPFSHMPLTTPLEFRAIPHASSENQKLLYAFGGNSYVNGKRAFSSKAFVCDFASSNSSPIWEELPPMPSELKICMGVGSPLDRNVYAFGFMLRASLNDRLTHLGLVFDPTSKSWNPCPHPFNGSNFYGRIGNYNSIDDYTLIDTENRSELCVFATAQAHTFNLSAAKWEGTLDTPIPIDVWDRGSKMWSTSVAVGHVVYKFYNRKLFALDSSSPKPSFQLVHGLDNKLPTYLETYTKPYIAYLGKGKLCIIWGSFPDPIKKAPKGTLSITCFKFWVGMCNRRNQLRAVIDQCEQFVAHGFRLHDVVAF